MHVHVHVIFYKFKEKTGHRLFPEWVELFLNNGVPCRGSVKHGLTVTGRRTYLKISLCFELSLFILDYFEFLHSELQHAYLLDLCIVTKTGKIKAEK